MSNRIAPKLLAEFIGTFAFVFIGAGTAAVVGGGAGLSGITAVAFAHGLAIMAFAFAYGSVSGGHMNPAVTVGVLAAGAMSFGEAIDRIQPPVMLLPQGPRLAGAERAAAPRPELERVGERDLHGNEKVACAMAFAVHAQGATAFGNAGADTSVFENRNQPEKQSGEQRDTESEVKNGQVDANVADPRESGGREGNEKTQGGAGQCQAEDAAQQANNSALAE